VSVEGYVRVYVWGWGQASGHGDGGAAGYERVAVVSSATEASEAEMI